MSLPDPAYLNSSAALIAMALLSILPKVELISVEVHDACFSCSFTCPTVLDSHLLELATEKCRQLAMQDLLIETRKMVAHNAAAYFEHLGRTFEADSLLENPLEVVDIVKIADFSLAQEGPHLSSTKQLLHLQLNSFSFFNQIYRLEGTAHASKEELKSVVRLLKTWMRERHEALCLPLKIFDPEGEGIWLSKGVLLKERLKLRISELIDQEGVALFESKNQKEVRYLDGGEWFQLESKGGSKERALLNSRTREACVIVFSLDLVNLEKTVKRSLHLIKKTSKILGLRLSWTLTLPSEKRRSEEVEKEFVKYLLSILESESLNSSPFSLPEWQLSKGERFSLVATAKDSLQKEWIVIDLIIEAQNKALQGEIKAKVKIEKPHWCEECWVPLSDQRCEPQSKKYSQEAAKVLLKQHAVEVSIKIQLPVSIERVIALNMECGTQHFNQWTKEIALSEIKSGELEEK